MDCALSRDIGKEVTRLLIENAKILRSEAREIESMENCVREICVGID